MLAARSIERRLPAAALAGATLGALPLVALAIDDAYAPFVAGAVLMVAGFAVMAPCEVQMAATLSTVLARMQQRATGGAPVRVRGAALRFAAGYVALYVPVALALGGLAALLGSAGWIMLALGAVATLALGLAALGRGRPAWLARCRGPLWLLRSGRASFDRPLRAGLAFGQYCASCCGPYVYAVAVLAGGTRSFWLGGTLVLAFAILMALPFGATVAISPASYSRLGQRLGGLAPALEGATGVVLVALSVALAGVAAAEALA